MKPMMNTSSDNDVIRKEMLSTEGQGLSSTRYFIVPFEDLDWSWNEYRFSDNLSDYGLCWPFGDKSHTLNNNLRCIGDSDPFKYTFQGLAYHIQISVHLTRLFDEMLISALLYIYKLWIEQLYLFWWSFLSGLSQSQACLFWATKGKVTRVSESISLRMMNWWYQTKTSCSIIGLSIISDLTGKQLKGSRE